MILKIAKIFDIEHQTKQAKILRLISHSYFHMLKFLIKSVFTGEVRSKLSSKDTIQKQNIKW